jgi:hypothetical protein
MVAAQEATLHIRDVGLDVSIPMVHIAESDWAPWSRSTYEDRLPPVTYLPLQSLTGGIMGIAKFPLDVLKNVLTLPLPDKTSHSK